MSAEHGRCDGSDRDQPPAPRPHAIERADQRRAIAHRDDERGDRAIGPKRPAPDQRLPQADAQRELIAPGGGRRAAELLEGM